MLANLSESAPGMEILSTLVIVLVAGTAAQIFADRVRLPATGPLLLVGLLLGPSLIGIVHPEALGDNMRAIVRAAVAVVVFEGGLLLDVDELRHTSRAVFGLISIGLLITTVLAGLLVWALLGWPWKLSLLFGGIVSVTGPTVITPILQRVRVNRRVRSTLESESVIADPLGVILATLIFTSIISSGGWQEVVHEGVIKLGAGILVGGGIAALVWLVAGRFALLPSKFARLGILGAALLAYTLADTLSEEAGVLAAAISGIVIGSLDIPYKEQVEEFKGDLASIAVSAVFILLAASLSTGDLILLGWRGAAVIAILMFVIRPLRVFLSTWGSELKSNEKAFISLLGPRGIVAASVATFFALELTDQGYAEGRMLVALVFGVIIVTVLIEGSAAGLLARWFKVMPRHNIIVGADEIGRFLAVELSNVGETVSLIDTDETACAAASDLQGVRVICGDATDIKVLKQAGAKEAKCLIATTSSDKVNLLVCHVARSEFNVPRLVARANSSNLTAFESAGIEAMSPSRAAATVLENMVLRPSLFRLLSSGGGAEHVIEAEITSPELVGKTIAQLALKGCVVAAIRRGEVLVAPNGATRLERGDIMTLLGSESAIDKALKQLHAIA